MPPIHTHDCDCTQPTASVVQRGAQTDCTEASCRDNARNATAWQRQQSLARSAGEGSERYSATQFSTRGRPASL